MDEFPDLSKPINTNIDYPDLSKPLSGEPSQQTMPASEALSVIAQSQMARPTQRTMQPQEQFSNPAFMPGFQKLSPEEQRQKLLFSLFDPANQMGERFVPGGTYENPVVRGMSSLASTALAPELKAGTGILSRYLINPLANAISRIGAGTASNVLYGLPETQKNRSLKDLASDALKFNTLLELPAAALRAPGYFAEMAYPQRLANQTMGNIQKGYNEALRAQEEAYKKALVPHGENFASIEKIGPVIKMPKEVSQAISSDTKTFVKRVKKEPTINNLHTLQSKLGKDQMAASRSKDFLKVQDIRKYRKGIQDSIQSELKAIDEGAANNYQLGREITLKRVSPYEATESINKIAEGRALERSPIQVRQAIRTAGEKKKSGRGPKAQLAVPEEHELRRHYEDLNKNIEFGKQMRYLVPAAGGAIGGYMANPSLSGLLTGGATGAIGAGLGHLGIPGLSQAILNPSLENVFRNYLSPIYYGAGRGLGGYSLEQPQTK